MRKNWNVTYEYITPESAENKESSDTGFDLENVSFREAMRHFGKYAEQANESPISKSVRWVTTNWSTDHRTGEQSSLSLHIPEQVTPSSRLRLARYLKLSV